MSGTEVDDPSDAGFAVRNLSFQSPSPGDGGEDPNGEDPNKGTPPVLLSPPVENVRFTSYVVKLLQSVITGNDDAIEAGISAFFKHFHITNEFGLSLLSEDDIPVGPENTIWSSTTFRKALWVVINGASTGSFSDQTSFMDLRRYLIPGGKSDDDGGSLGSAPNA